MSTANIQDKHAAVARYAALLQKDTGKAAKFLSSVFKPKNCFHIQLKDEVGNPMDVPDMISTLVDDLIQRANNDFPQDSGFEHSLALRTSCLRSRSFVLDASSVYTEDELLEVLCKLETSTKCIRGCFAALKVQQPAALQLTLALVNLGRQFGITSSLWALREFRPLHKKGPLVVSNVSNLRPISLCCDMAHVQDGLWMARNKWKLIEFAGPAQSGGFLDPISSVIGLVLLTQIRNAQSLPTFWAILDLKWAFDTAILPGMKVAVGDAGVDPLDWLLLDDIMDQDLQCLSLHGFLSRVFKLGCGTAQGRKFSVGVFNALLRWLHDEVEHVVPGGARAWLPKYAPDLLRSANLWSPVREVTSLPPRLEMVQDVAACIKELLPDDLNIQQGAFHMAVSSLCSLTRDSERRLAIDLLGEAGLVAAQHVDDTTVPCSSIGHVRAIVAANEASACASYAYKTKSAFQYGRGKCAVLCFQTAPRRPTPEECGCEVVSSKKLLGVLVDEDLSFEPCLNEALARGWSSFVQMFNAAESAGFSVAVLTTEICRRLVPEILFAAPLLVTASGVEHKLNRLQWRWGRSLLGASRDFALPWALVFSQCGWPLRLGSVVIEEAAIALAKLFLLPYNHPGATYVRLALECDFPTWLSRVCDTLHDRSLPRPVPLIYEQDHFQVAVLEAARTDAKTRKDLLRQYRQQVVRPILRDYDDLASSEARNKLLPGFSFASRTCAGRECRGFLLSLIFGLAQTLCYGIAPGLWFAFLEPGRYAFSKAQVCH